MRILILSWNFPPRVGGIEAVVYNLFKTLRTRGHEAVAVVPPGDGRSGEDGVARGRRRGLACFLAYALKEGFVLCRSFRPELILCGSVVTLIPGLLLSKLFKLPTAVIVYGADLLHGSLVYRWVTRRFLRRCDAVTAISRETARLAQEAGVRSSRLAVIPPGVETAKYTRVPDGGGGAISKKLAGRKVLLYVGRLVRRKGLIEFIRHVMPALARARPEALLVIAGEDATASLVHKERVMRLILDEVAKLGLQEHVSVLGAVEDAELIRLYHSSHVFILPCLEMPCDMEGFGIVFLEAALAGLPSVATRTGGIPDAVADGETGILVPPGDFKGVYKAVDMLLTDESLRKKMGLAARRRALEEFDWQAIAARYEALFGRVAGNDAAGKPQATE